MSAMAAHLLRALAAHHRLVQVAAMSALWDLHYCPLAALAAQYLQILTLVVGVGRYYPLAGCYFLVVGFCFLVAVKWAMV